MYLLRQVFHCPCLEKTWAVQSSLLTRLKILSHPFRVPGTRPWMARNAILEKKNFFFQKVFEESSGVLRSAFRKNTLTARHKIEWTESRYREDVLWFGHLIAWKKNYTLVGNVCSCKKLRIEREAIEYERYFLRLTIWRKSRGSGSV